MDHRVSKDMISSGMTPSGEKTQADLGKSQYGSVPSPNRLMDAYHSMYQDQKQENLDEKIDPLNLGASKRTLQQKQQDRKIQSVKSGMANTGSYMDKKEVPQNKKENSTDVDDKKKDKSKGFGESSADLLAAYYAVYEHHQKDENGNTIPHEDDVKEGKIPAGLQAYLDKKKGKKEDKKDKKDMKEDADLFDTVLDIFVAEGYEKKDAYKVMSQLTEEQLNEFAISGTIATLGAGVLKGMLGAGKVAAAAGKGALSAGKMAASKGLGAVKTAASAGAKKITSVAKTGMTKASDALGKVSNIAKDKAKGMGDTMTNMGKGIGDEIKSDIKNEIKRKIIQGDGGSNKITPIQTGTRSTGSKIAASADLFDIVKGQLLDEGLSEEEIKDIMLTLTPDEIIEELSDSVKRNDALNRERAMKAAQERKVPQDIRDKAKKQYKAGTPRENPNDPYTKQDAKDIRDYYKDK